MFSLFENLKDLLTEVTFFHATGEGSNYQLLVTLGAVFSLAHPSPGLVSLSLKYIIFLSDPHKSYTTFTYVLLSLNLSKVPLC